MIMISLHKLPKPKTITIEGTVKLRWKILITIGLAILAVWLQDQIEKHEPHASASYGRCEGLEIWYSEYNSGYFQDKLPNDVVIDYGEYNPDFMATTSQLPDGRFHIAFNEVYTKAPRVAHITLLHEMCHVKTFDERDPETVHTLGGSHGPRWRRCMLILDFDGAFRRELIDAYERE